MRCGDLRWLLLGVFLSVSLGAWSQPDSGTVDLGNTRVDNHDEPDSNREEELKTIADEFRKQAKAAPSSTLVRRFYQEIEQRPECQPGKWPGDCLNALLEDKAIVADLPADDGWEPEYLQGEKAIEKVAGDLREDVKQALDNVATGLGLPGLGGVVENFQETALDSLLHLEDLEEPQTLGYRIPLPRVWWFQPRLTSYATPLPEINPLLKKRLAAEGRAELLASSEDGLEFGDDYFVAVDVSLLGPFFGRDLNDSIEPRQNLLRSVTRSGSEQNYRDAARYLDLNTELDRRALAVAAATLTEFEVAVWGRIRNARLNEFWKLIHNQPQLDLQFKRLNRDDIVGADAESFRLRFGTGLVNLTRLRLFSDCNFDLANEECPGAYADLVEKSWLLKHGAGVSAYYEQGDIADLSVELPPLAGDGGLLLGELLPGEASRLGFDSDNPNRFVIDGGRFRQFGWAIGATLTDPKIGRQSGSSLRADLAADYYRYDRDPVRLDHEVLRFTLTWRRGALSIPLHLMYRSDTEFEANVDDRLALGLGVSFRH